jgi:hypothetical protein
MLSNLVEQPHFLSFRDDPVIDAHDNLQIFRQVVFPPTLSSGFKSGEISPACGEVDFIVHHRTINYRLLATPLPSPAKLDAYAHITNPIKLYPHANKTISKQPSRIPKESWAAPGRCRSASWTRLRGPTIPMGARGRHAERYEFV